MLIQTKYRSAEQEIMDDLSMEGEMLRNSLDQLAIINQTLGGNSTTINGLHMLCNAEPENSIIKIIDIGCGSGDMLRTVAEYGRRNKLNFKLTGIDANDYTVTYARELSVNYPEIRYIQMDVQSRAFSELEFDIALATLFLHHFTIKKLKVC